MLPLIFSRYLVSIALCVLHMALCEGRAPVVLFTALQVLKNNDIPLEPSLLQVKRPDS